MVVGGDSAGGQLREIRLASAVVSDLNTKACSCKDRERLVPQLMGHSIWTAFSKEDKDVKPGVCKQCISADLTFTFSDSEMRWQGLCNSCGTITLA